MSRNSRLTADVSLEAHNLLRGYAEKHERSKGFLLEKMIRKFCAEIDVNKEDSKPKQELAIAKPATKRFVKPLFIDVDNYMVERGCLDPVTQAEKFCDFYESKGWLVGKNKMKCWKAAVRNWLKGQGDKAQSKDILKASSASDWHLKEDTGF